MLKKLNYLLTLSTSKIDQVENFFDQIEKELKDEIDRVLNF